MTRTGSLFVEVGETVEIHDDHFSPDAKDEDWLVEVGKRGWIVLTKDDRIRYRVTERTALTSSRVRAFVLTSSQLQGTEMAAAFVKHFHGSSARERFSHHPVKLAFVGSGPVKKE